MDKPILVLPQRGIKGLTNDEVGKILLGQAIDKVDHLVAGGMSKHKAKCAVASALNNLSFYQGTEPSPLGD